ncbi:hypothetical protein ASPFODRAFT_577574 [Aspergillus luchuensis CBS 106.47]|uniref:Uncharacterized protein n=1 Tax=Aspergillus luchuensis (strain CBS 106.47) TaxID=1137211 RepID=A0A1M3TL86_ASPLC|nr:hypothetical protein ASPFODRAFT_577574 [Aspergillus luchuensis CBS 106.47]
MHNLRVPGSRCVKARLRITLPCFLRTAPVPPWIFHLIFGPFFFLFPNFPFALPLVPFLFSGVPGGTSHHSPQMRCIAYGSWILLGGSGSCI